jgi:hypothetical protein
VERCPQAYQGLGREIGTNVLRYSEAAGLPPDIALLARVARALGGEAEEDPAFQALKAKIGAIFEAAKKSGALDEDALAELPAEIAERTRAAWAAAQADGGETTDTQ